MKNLTKLNQFVKVFQNNVETDMTFTNILWFAQQAVFGGLKVENVNFVTMPNTPVSCWSRTYQNYQSYVVPNAQELLDLVNSDLSPFVEPSVLSDLDIMSINADGSVSSTSGQVEDSAAAKPPVKPAKPAETEEPVIDGEDPIVPVDPSDPNNSGTVVTDPTQPPAETTDPSPAPVPADPEEPAAEPEDPAPEAPQPEEPQPEEPQDPGFSIIEPPPAA